MSFYKELLYGSNHAVSPVVKIQFSVLSPDTIRRRSVVEVASSKSMRGPGGGPSSSVQMANGNTAPSSNMTYRYDEPVQNGLFDPRMGVVDLGKTCPTCGQRHTFCPGHFGHIELARPVFAVQFFEIVRRCLRCVCVHCSSILLPPASTTSAAGSRKPNSNQRRFEATHRICQKVKRCPVCDMRQPDKVQRDGVLRIALEWSSTASESSHRHVLLAEDVLRIFRRVTDHDAALMGMTYRPEWLILTVLVVPPPSVRPTVRNDTGQRQEDDLTHKLITIVKANTNLRSLIQKQQLGGGEQDVDIEVDADEAAANESWAAAGYGPISTKLPPQQDTVLSWLQYEVATLIDNNFPGLAPSQQVRSGRVMRSVTDRLRGKEGRIRGNLLGKRVDFSARSVITPDPHIGVDELGVPLAIATNLTFAEVVNRFSVARLRQVVRNGPSVYPGARFVRKLTLQGQTIRLASVSNLGEVADALEVGDIVDRHLVDGDCVMFNRQPSLHKMSMMAHRIRVLPHETFRLNVCVTPCYNADFDGDEMNMHVPQSTQTHEEIRSLASVEKQIISPKDSKPIVSIVQDVVLGVFLMTATSPNVPEFKISQQDAFNLLGSLTTTYDQEGGLSMRSLKQMLASKKAWTGRELLSRVLPRYLTLRSNNLNIVDGEILSGKVTKSAFQAQSKGILHMVNNDLGGRRAIRLLNDTQRLVCDWLVRHGFSVGASDAILPPATLAKISDAHDDMDERVRNLVTSLHDGRFRNPSTKSNSDAFEDALSGIVAECRKMIESESLASVDAVTNRLMTMIESGSKGNNVNMTQIAACVGQQMVDNQRISYSLDHRTLPHFCKFDDTPSARGYVKSSFAHGLNPQEFFFHAIGGREGLIDTAVKTSSSGYTQRKLAKAMEDLKLWHDGTLRKANGAIVQFLYGEDGMDPTSIEKQRLPTLSMSNSAIMDAFGSGMKTSAASLPNGIASKMTRAAQLAWKKSATALLEVHVRKLVEDKENIVFKVFNGRDQGEDVLFPVNVEHLLSLHAAARDPETLFDIDVSKALDAINSFARDVPKMLGVIVRCHASPRKLVEMRCTAQGLEAALSAMRDRLISSYAHAGELSGIIAAQSISEPTTQLTLNSVDWSTELLLSVDSVLKRVKIGEYIDSVIASAKAEDADALLRHDDVSGHSSRLEDHKNRTTLAWINRPGMPVVKVLSPDENGKVAWQLLEAVTQHPPINADGSPTLLKVKTATGREVIATKAKSFLMRKDNKLVASRGEELRIGDYLPVSDVLPALETVVEFIRVSDYLSKTSDMFVFMSEIDKADRKSLEKKRVTFQLPYTRSDIFAGSRFVDASSKFSKPECIYPKFSTMQTAHIPEEIPLDKEFGFFMGAYAAEGWCTEHAVLFSSNLHAGYIDKIHDFCNKYSINYHIDHKEATQPGSSNTIRLHSLVLAQLLIGCCGRDAADKRLPMELLSAPTCFKKAFIEGYFSGDGCVDNEIFCVSASSVNRGLLEDVSNMLVCFGIRSCLRPHLKVGHDETMTYVLQLQMDAGNSHKFAQTFSLCIKSNQDSLLKKTAPKINGDIIPGIVLGGSETESVSLTKAEINEQLESECTPESAKEILRAALAQDVFYDRIISIEEVESPHEFVYDLTVENTRTFQTYHGLGCYDTFHLSGYSDASRAVRGLPRLQEIIDVTSSKNMRTPIMRIMGKSALQARKLQSVFLKHVVTCSRIMFDRQRHDCTRASLEDSLKSAGQSIPLQADTDDYMPWMVAMEFSRTELLHYGITMLDIDHAISDHFGSAVMCMVSTDNVEGNPFVHVRTQPPPITGDALVEMRALEDVLLDSIKIRGVSGIHDVTILPDNTIKYYKTDADGTFVKAEDSMVAETDGSNLVETLGQPWINAADVYSNDIADVYNTFGIEAAREVIYREIMQVMDEGGIKINYRHISVLIDTMTSRGNLMSINRHGINQSDNGPLAKSSFEETNDRLIKAGAFAEVDNMQGVSANIMFGQIAPYGTADSRIVINMDRLPKVDRADVYSNAFAMH